MVYMDLRLLKSYPDPRIGLCQGFEQDQKLPRFACREHTGPPGVAFHQR